MAKKTKREEKPSKVKFLCSGKEERQKALQKVGTILSEFFDAAFVVVTWEEEGKTFKMDLGLGNKFTIDGLLDDIVEEKGWGGLLNDEDEDEDWKNS